MARVFGLQGQFAEARELCRAARAGAPDSVRPLVVTAWVEARAGAADAAREVLAELDERATRQFVPRYYVAAAYAALGDRDRAFEELAKACDERTGYAPFLRVELMFEALRSDPRFGALLKRVGLV